MGCFGVRWVLVGFLWVSGGLLWGPSGFSWIFSWLPGSVLSQEAQMAALRVQLAPGQRELPAGLNRGPFGGHPFAADLRGCVLVPTSFVVNGSQQKRTKPFVGSPEKIDQPLLGVS